MLKNDEALRQKGVGFDHDTGGLGMMDGDIEVYRTIIASLDRLSGDDIAKMRGSEAIHRIINRSVEDAGIFLQPDDPAWRQLELAFIKAQRRAVQAISSRLEGEEIETPQIVSTKLLSLTGALGNWSLPNSRAAKTPRQQSVDEAGRAVQRFVELHGDLDVAAINKTHTREFRETRI